LILTPSPAAKVSAPSLVVVQLERHRIAAVDLEARRAVVRRLTAKGKVSRVALSSSGPGRRAAVDDALLAAPQHRLLAAGEGRLAVAVGGRRS
jgi:hypothetical protein